MTRSSWTTVVKKFQYNVHHQQLKASPLIQLNFVTLQWSFFTLKNCWLISKRTIHIWQIYQKKGLHRSSKFNYLSKILENTTFIVQIYFSFLLLIWAYLGPPQQSSSSFYCQFLHKDQCIVLIPVYLLTTNYTQFVQLVSTVVPFLFKQSWVKSKIWSRQVSWWDRFLYYRFLNILFLLSVLWKRL